jgi:two-component system, NarL family, response regulator LiaR
MEHVSELPTRVVVVDDQIMVSEIMALSISKERDFSLAGVANTTRDAAVVVKREHPDVIVLNYRNCDEQYVEVARSMLDQSPNSRIVIVSGNGDDERPREAIGVDRARIVGKNSSIAEILSAIRRAARGELVVAPAHAH